MRNGNGSRVNGVARNAAKSSISIGAAPPLFLNRSKYRLNGYFPVPMGVYIDPRSEILERIFRLYRPGGSSLRAGQIFSKPRTQRSGVSGRHTLPIRILRAQLG